MYNLTNPSNLFQSSMLSHFPIFRTSCYSISPTPNLRSLKISLWIKIFLSTCYRTYIRATAMDERLWMISSPLKTSHQTWYHPKTSRQTWSPPQTLCSPRKISHQTSISSPRKICRPTFSPPSWTPHSCLKVKEASQSQTSCKSWALSRSNANQAITYEQSFHVMPLKNIRQVVFVEAPASDQQLWAEHDCLCDWINQQVLKVFLVRFREGRPLLKSQNH